MRTDVLFRSNRNVVYSNKFDIVWCSGYRRRVLVNGVDMRLKEIITAASLELQAAVIEMEIMPDHVHLLVKQLKGCSSRLLHQEFPTLKSRMPTLWTNSYFVSTVGGAPLEIIKQYIGNQKSV